MTFRDWVEWMISMVVLIALVVVSIAIALSPLFAVLYGCLWIFRDFGLL